MRTMVFQNVYVVILQIDSKNFIGHIISEYDGEK